MSKDVSPPPSLRKFCNLQNDIRKEIRQRVKFHQLRIAQLAARPRAARHLNILADGDSWFDYPLPLVPPQHTDIIAQLRSLIKPVPYILNLAHYGLAITEMMGVSRYTRLVEQLNNPANGRFDAILFSGGGNDLVGEQFRLWLNDAASVGDDPAKALNDNALGHIVGVAMAGYRDLLAARATSPQRDVPIFVHAYDFAWPTNEGVCDGLVGPWLYPSLESRGWMASQADLNRGFGIVRQILQRFRGELVNLAKTEPHVVLVETQHTLLTTQEWANELHPKPPGFKNIAQKFVDALKPLQVSRPKVTTSASSHRKKASSHRRKA
jgi:hypothetical protein